MAAALTRLGEMRARCGARDDLRSLAWSTAASLHRQAGRHRAAHILDGRALAAAAPFVAPQCRVRHDLGRAALSDALVGLAADNLGLMRLTASQRLLDRCDVLTADLDTEHPGRWDHRQWETGGRGWLRSRWVRAELAMYFGVGTQAVEISGAAVAATDEITDGITPRHRIKTRLIAAAADAAAGDLDRSAARARQLADHAREEGLGPLQWAALSLLAGTGAASQTERDLLVNLRDRLRRQGMPLSSADDR